MRLFSSRLIVGIFITLMLLDFVSATEKNKLPKVTFLDKDKASEEIVNDKIQPYFEKLQPMEMAAKTGTLINGASIEDQRKECIKRYRAGAREFTEEEKKAIKWHVEKASEVLVSEYPKLGNLPWSFLKVSDDIEGGLPHTRDNHIILSDTMCKQILLIQKMPPDRMAFLGIVELFIHEQLHVFQRVNKNKFDSLYKNTWGFIKADSIDGCEWLTKHHLVNPDAVECPWILPVGDEPNRKYIWPLVVFSEGNGIKHMPGDFRMLAIELVKKEKGFEVKTDSKGIPVARPLMSVLEFRKLFPMSKNIYHPNEASADLIAKLVTFENLIPKEKIPAQVRENVIKSLKPLKDWCGKNLK